jgi:hypothetical protein
LATTGTKLGARSRISISLAYVISLMTVAKPLLALLETPRFSAQDLLTRKPAVSVDLAASHECTMHKEKEKKENTECEIWKKGGSER